MKEYLIIALTLTWFSGRIYLERIINDDEDCHDTGEYENWVSTTSLAITSKPGQLIRLLTK